MTAQFECNIPKPGGRQLGLVFEKGQSIVIIGANGSGKTRLGVYIENSIPSKTVHRIAAHKSLTMSDTLSLISLERADKTLRFGYAEGTEAHKANVRWQNKPATHLLNDFDALLQTLFAAHNLTASEHLQKRKLTPNIPVPTTKLEELKRIWEGLLPHRVLEIKDAAVRVLPQSPNGAVGYGGSEMSDGERAIFYFIGQCLVAQENGVIIIDEPEAHVHKAILLPLWESIEKARPDCSFIYITHDLDFAVTHNASAKYFIRGYNHAPLGWDIEEIPQDTGLPEQVVAELVGSRKPILFVEGERNSLDLCLYRSCYPAFTIVPVGSCEAVIHSVASYRGSAALHWLQVRGLVDGDDRDSTEVAFLQGQNVYVLPVAEVENLLLLPDVFLALAESLLCPDPAALLGKLTTEVMREAGSNLDLVSARYATRQLDRRLKGIEVKAKDLMTLQAAFGTGLSTVNPIAVFNGFRMKLEQYIHASDLPGVLRLYDNKGLLARAASLLGLRDQKHLLEKLVRLLGADTGQKVREELARVLPSIA